MLQNCFSMGPDRIVVGLDWKGTMHEIGKQPFRKGIEQFAFRDGKILAIARYWLNIPTCEK